MQEVRCRLCSEDDDTKIIKSIEEQLKDIKRRLGEGRAVLVHLQNQLINVACDDPGAAIGTHLALPILRVGWASLDELCCGSPVAVLHRGYWPCQVPHLTWAECMRRAPALRSPRGPQALWRTALQSLRAP